MTSFFSLPREIRDQIYLYLIKQKINTADFSSKYCASTFRLRFHPAIFQVNRQIHQEACQTLYGLNSFAINVDPYSPCISQKLEALTRLSLYPWVKKYVVKVSFVDGLSLRGHGDGEVRRLLPRDAVPRMRTRLRVLVKLLSRACKIDSLRIDWHSPGAKLLPLDQQLALLQFFEPFCGHALVAKVSMHRPDNDGSGSKDGSDNRWKGLDEQLEMMERALEGGKDDWPTWTPRPCDTAAPRSVQNSRNIL